jgi:hypothetical protein
MKHVNILSPFILQSTSPRGRCENIHAGLSGSFKKRMKIALFFPHYENAFSEICSFFSGFLIKVFNKKEQIERGLSFLKIIVPLHRSWAILIY